MRIEDKFFFRQPALTLAEFLLGKILVRRLDDGSIIRRRIVETEAYGGSEDSASHASRGKTKRNAPMFEEGGIAYVYLCYGIFDLLNIISGERGSPEGVLIRGVDGAGGPGRAGRTMGITRELNREDLLTSPRLWIEDDGFIVDKQNIRRLKRVGIGYASIEDQEKLWRFLLPLN